MKRTEKIEILGLDLFDALKEEMSLVESLRQNLGMSIGWHYHLDLAWMVKNVKGMPAGSLILDAGAGSGLSQFILAELGFNVISVDFMTRSFSRKMRGRYAKSMHFLNDQSETFENSYTGHLRKTYGSMAASVLGQVSKYLAKKSHGAATREEAAAFVKGRMASHSGGAGNAVKKPASIFIYKSDLKDMKLLPGDFADAVVSISALEHNSHADLEKCMDELLRVVKPGGLLCLTVGASTGGDFFHEPSKGWCYSEASMKKLFRLPEAAESNFSRAGRLFREFKEEGNELQKRLAPFYFKSGDNGMPWGKWDPKYLPAGILKYRF